MRVESMTSPIVITWGKSAFLLVNYVPSKCLVSVYIVTVVLHIGTIGLPRLARALLTLIGSCRIYYDFKIKAGKFRKRYRFCNRFAKEKSLTVTNIL